jgi:hypothetical protein
MAALLLTAILPVEFKEPRKSRSRDPPGEEIRRADIPYSTTTE